MYQHERPAQPFVPAQPARSSARVVFQLGTIFGTIWAALFLLWYLFRKFFLFHIVSAQLAAAISGWFTSSTLPVFIVTLFGMGILAGKQTGKMTSGIFTSLWIFLWTAISSAILHSIISLPIGFPFPFPSLEEFLRNLSASYIMSVLVILIMDAILGALGGLVGRWIWRRKKT